MVPYAVAACLLVTVSTYLLVYFGYISHGTNDLGDETAGLKNGNNQHISIDEEFGVSHLPGWKIKGIDAKYTVAGNRIILQRGELYVQSVPVSAGEICKPLTILTPVATATCTETTCYIGTHQESGPPDFGKGSAGMGMDGSGRGAEAREVTRLLVMSGEVSLTNPSGSVSGSKNDLLIAQTNLSPVRKEVQCNGDFAFNLYHQLARTYKGNLLLSPASVSVILAMSFEGARGQTARQIGQVLCLPGDAMRLGDNSQLAPWRVSLLHTGSGELGRLLTGADSLPAQDAEREKLRLLRSELKQVRATLAGIRPLDKEWSRAMNKERRLVSEVNELISRIERYELKIAHGLWAPQEFALRDKYVNTVKRYCKTGGVYNFDYTDKSSLVPERINDWVSRQTDGHIKRIMPQMTMDQGSQAGLVMASAIYFKGNWLESFNSKETRRCDFHLPDGQVVKADMMHAGRLSKARYGVFASDWSPVVDTPVAVTEEKLPESNTEHTVMVELPFHGGMSMVLIIPDSPDKLSRIEGELDSRVLAACLKRLMARNIKLSMPKFRIETEYDLKAVLQNMGMIQAFSRSEIGGADFTGMCGENSSGARLHTSSVIHKSVIEVAEQGAEVAMSLSPDYQGPGSAMQDIPEIRVDRPFLFYIRDTTSGMILFMGRIISAL